MSRGIGFLDRRDTALMIMHLDNGGLSEIANLKVDDLDLKTYGVVVYAELLTSG